MLIFLNSIFHSNCHTSNIICNEKCCIKLEKSPEEAFIFLRTFVKISCCYNYLKYQGDSNISNFFHPYPILLSFLLQNPGAMCSLLTFKLSKSWHPFLMNQKSFLKGSIETTLQMTHVKWCKWHAKIWSCHQKGQKYPEARHWRSEDHDHDDNHWYSEGDGGWWYLRIVQASGHSPLMSETITR